MGSLATERNARIENQFAPQNKECLEKMGTRHQRLRYLRLHGIPVEGTREVSTYVQSSRYVYVYVYEFQAVKMLEVKIDGVWLNRRTWEHSELVLEERKGQMEPAEEAALEEWAMRAVYAMGLTAGAVLLRIHSARRVRVVEVYPDPPVSDDIAALYCEIMDRTAAHSHSRRIEGTGKAGIRIGADVEFALRDAAGTMALASDFLNRGGLIGYDAVRWKEGNRLYQHPLVELRPPAASEPEQLFRRICRLMQMAKQKIGDSSLQWIAGGMPFSGYPTGGHIHFSGVPLTSLLVRKLDAYLALPFALVEDESCRKRRPRYGFLGDVRVKAHGGFEYRTLPSWLVSPQMTRGVLTLAWLIVSEHEALPLPPWASWEGPRAYYQCDYPALKQFAIEAWNHLYNVPLYKKYSVVLDPFFRTLLTAEPWAAMEDIRKTWGLTVSVQTADEEPVRVMTG